VLKHLKLVILLALV